MMTPHVVAYTITASWVLTVGLASPKLFNSGDYTKVAEYAVCQFHGGSFIELLLAFTLPTLMSSLLAIMIDAYLANKVYKVSKQIEKETRLSGVNTDQLKTLK